MGALPHYAQFTCPEGDASFSILQVSQLPIGDGIYIYFEVGALDSYVDSLLEIGIRFDSLPEDQRWLWREARFKDPDGNQLILYKAGKNRLNPPWIINQFKFESIVEY